MSWLVRLVLYSVVMFLVMAVYVGQKQTMAGPTMALAARKTVKAVAWTVVAVFTMLGLTYLFID